jgi:uncharacterized protein (DUF2147 family)
MTVMLIPPNGAVAIFYETQWNGTVFKSASGGVFFGTIQQLETNKFTTNGISLGF